MDDVFMQFMEYHAISIANQNLIQNLEIQVGKSYSMEKLSMGARVTTLQSI